MLRTLNPAKSYGREFSSRRCKAEIKWHLNRHWLNPTSGMPQSRLHGDEGSFSAVFKLDESAAKIDLTQALINIHSSDLSDRTRLTISDSFRAVA